MKYNISLFFKSSLILDPGLKDYDSRIILESFVYFLIVEFEGVPNFGSRDRMLHGFFNELSVWHFWNVNKNLARVRSHWLNRELGLVL